MKQPIQTSVPGHEPIVLYDYYEEFIRYYANCEPETKKWFVDNARPDWVYLDCGANIGYYSILFSRLSPQGLIHAFEPTSTVEKLNTNLTQHNIQNVRVHQIALGARSGDINDGIFRIWGSEAERQVYPFMTIDDFVENEGLDRLDCIKIDVDSFDFEVLLGAEKTMRRFDPYVVVELNHALVKRNQSNAEALDWLSSLGYEHSLNLEYENFVLKKNPPSPIAPEGAPKHTVFFTNFKSYHSAPAQPSQPDGAPQQARVATVETLHQRLGFKEPIDYPAASRNKPLTQWRMEDDDSPIFRYIYRNMKPKRHLEFGTWEGTGATYCLEECDATVWTINLLEGEKEADGGPVYRVPKEQVENAPEWSATFGHAIQTDSFGFIGRFYREKGFSHRVCQIYCDSMKWDTSNYPEGFFDTILIDGGHQTEIVVSDTMKSLPLCRPGGLIMWHDFCPAPDVLNKSPVVQGVYKGIRQLWNQIHEQVSDLFWVQPSHILIGVKK